MTNKIISVLTFLVFTFQFQFCSSKRAEPRYAQPSGNSDTVQQQTASGISPFQLIDTVGLTCSTDVTAYSPDSVVAFVRFRNISKTAIELFKPRLPVDSAAGISFVVLDKEYRNIKYRKQGKSFYPRLLDSVSANDIFALPGGGEIAYKVNLSHYYNFQTGDQFFIDYYYLFPLLANAKHVSDSSYGFARPVWFAITSIKKDSSGHLIRNQISLRKD